ncbi:MAG: type II secretion system protein [Nitrospirota bacterium]|jgi:type II secretory pathway pseudopilin PulG
MGEGQGEGESGFTYLTLMFSIVIIGIGLSVIGPSWKTAKKIENEEELLFRGKEIVDAIIAYYTGFPGQQAFPAKLEDLLKDPRYPTTKRYLRKLYRDPITNGDWTLILDANQRIRGAKSKSEEAPLKKANFPDEFKSFEGKKKYNEWVFEYMPKSQTIPKIPTSQPVPVN